MSRSKLTRAERERRALMFLLKSGRSAYDEHVPMRDRVTLSTLAGEAPAPVSRKTFANGPCRWTLTDAGLRRIGYVRCDGEAHGNIFIDNCGICLHHTWGWRPASLPRVATAAAAALAAFKACGHAPEALADALIELREIMARETPGLVDEAIAGRHEEAAE